MCLKRTAAKALPPIIIGEVGLPHKPHPGAGHQPLSPSSFDSPFSGQR